MDQSDARAIRVERGEAKGWHADLIATSGQEPNLTAARKPKGAISGKEWREAIRLAVHELRDDPEGGAKSKVLRQLARRLVEKALTGDMAALKEIGDRLDGRSALGVELAGKDGEDLSFTVRFVKADGD